MSLIFQYGSNLDIERLNSPDRLSGRARSVGLAVTCEPFELEFSTFSTKNHCAAANLLRGSGRPIWGILYEIPENLVHGPGVDGIRSMDQIEGGNYSCQEICLNTEIGKRIAEVTFTYLVINRQEGIPTSLEYVSHILKGLNEVQAPRDYIDYVLTIIETNNPLLKDQLATYREGAI